MNAWWSEDQAKDRCRFLEHHKRNGIKIALSLVEILKKISKLCFGGVLEARQ